MDSFGYVKGLEKAIIDLGARVIDKFRLKNNQNHLNPCICFVVEPPPTDLQNIEHKLTVPGTSSELDRFPSYLTSNEFGLLFPEIHSVPVLRLEHSLICNLEK